MDTTRSSLALLIISFGFFLSSPGVVGADDFRACRPISAPLPAEITDAGTYCLSGNLSTSMLRGAAIFIRASNVVLDLNGFILEGLANREETTAAGVTNDFFAKPQDITIRNGTVRGFFEGVGLWGSNVTVEGIRADRNSAMGIRVTGDGAVIRGNQVVAPGGTRVGGSLFFPARGIFVAGSAPRVLNNDVTGIRNDVSATATGIVLRGVGGLVINNRIVTVERGIEFSGMASDGKYRDNLTFDVVTPYIGGTDAGNNH